MDAYHDLKCLPGTLYENGVCNPIDGDQENEYIHGLMEACVPGDVTFMSGVNALAEK